MALLLLLLFSFSDFSLKIQCTCVYVFQENFLWVLRNASIYFHREIRKILTLFVFVFFFFLKKKKKEPYQELCDKLYT